MTNNCKVILIGDSGIGKTSFLNRYINNEYDNIVPTIGIDFKCKDFKINDEKLRLQIWDTAGQERFRNLISSYYRSTDCFILMFDLTNEKSFNNLNYWYNEIVKYKFEESVFILIGTKKDLKEKRAVNSEAIKKFISDKKIKYFEISSKNNYGIECIFDHIAETMTESKSSKSIDINVGDNQIKITKNISKNNTNKKSYLCC